MDRCKVIFNPYSGRGQGRKLKTRLIAALEAAALNFELIETDYPGHGIELATQARRDGFATIVAAGGDGT